MVIQSSNKKTKLILKLI